MGAVSCDGGTISCQSVGRKPSTVSSKLMCHVRLSIDDGSTFDNSTNLALKAIFGIQAMAEISRLLDKESDAQIFNVQQSF